MENITINQLFPLEITKIQSALHTVADPQINTNRLQEVLVKSLNSLGEQSSKAQGLNKVITNSEKLHTSDHWLYLLKDAAANNGNGEFIGYIKVGHKHLYMFNDESKVYELEPLCILDFFIVHDYQRCGKGKLLFDFMLNDTKSRVHELAIDGPSKKMEKFMQKNYGIDHLIRQSNNFAISHEFFTNHKPKRSQRTAPQAVQSIGRFAARKQHSSVGNIIHGDAGGCRDRDNGSSQFAPVQIKFFRDTETQTDKEPTLEESHKPDGRIEQGAQPVLLTATEKPGIFNLSAPAARPHTPPATLSPSPHAAPDIFPSACSPSVSPTPCAHASSDVRFLSAQARPVLLFPAIRNPPVTLPSTARIPPAARLQLSPNKLTTAGLATPRETDDPMQVTKRGHLDIKFYHNKLW